MISYPGSDLSVFLVWWGPLGRLSGLRARRSSDEAAKETTKGARKQGALRKEKERKLTSKQGKEAGGIALYGGIAEIVSLTMFQESAHLQPGFSAGLGLFGAGLRCLSTFFIF